jgi:glucokinase
MKQKLEGQYNIGVDIGGTKINIGIVDEKGNIIIKHKIKTESEKGYQYIIDNIIHTVILLQEESGILKDQINSIGFGIPGTIDSRKGEVLFAPNLKWKNLAFVDLIKKQIDYDVYIGQDSQAATLAEFLFGAGISCENIICITIGTGISCGIILNKKIFRGSYNTAGEIGHTICKYNGRICNCGKRGCLEVYASGPVTENEARRLKLSKKSNITSKQNRITSKEIFELAQDGDLTAIKIINRQIHYLGIEIVNLLDTLGPDKILITGGLCNEEKLLLEPLIEFVRQNSYFLASEKVIIEKAKLGPNAPMIGAAMFFRDSEMS